MSKNSYLIQFSEINTCQVMVCTFYTVYNKHEMIKIGKQNQRKIASIMANARIILLPTKCRIELNSISVNSIYKFASSSIISKNKPHIFKLFIITDLIAELFIFCMKTKCHTCIRKNI